MDSTLQKEEIINLSLSVFQENEQKMSSAQKILTLLTRPTYLFEKDKFDKMLTDRELYDNFYNIVQKQYSNAFSGNVNTLYSNNSRVVSNVNDNSRIITPRTKTSEMMNNQQSEEL